MKLRCHRPSLMTALQIVSGVIPTRTPKDILKNAKLQVADGRATLTGTDQEIGIRYQIPGVESESNGETLLPTQRVSSILRELQDEMIDVEINENEIDIRSSHSEFRLTAEDPAEFPPMTDFHENDHVVLPGRTLQQMIRRTIFATDVESTRYALGGVLLERNEESLTLAATDSRRLAVVTANCQVHGEQPFRGEAPVVPAKAMSLIERSLSDAMPAGRQDDEEVSIAAGANEVLIQGGNSMVYSRLVEGRFPRYGDVIPQESQWRADLVVGPFYSAVRQAQIVTNEDSRGVDFAFSEGQVTLTSQATDVGQSTVDLPVSYSGEDLTITFDPRYLADFLKVLDPETQITLHLIDSESAAVFKTDDSYTYVVMPLSRER